MREKIGGLRDTSEVFDGAAFARKLETLLADAAEEQGLLECSKPRH
jgi:predicted O-linked N-acetylglucosamine transferase (SPINDLY family)